jgi:hypothetical protein
MISRAPRRGIHPSRPCGTRSNRTHRQRAHGLSRGRARNATPALTKRPVPLCRSSARRCDVAEFRDGAESTSARLCARLAALLMTTPLGRRCLRGGACWAGLNHRPLQALLQRRRRGGRGTRVRAKAGRVADGVTTSDRRQPGRLRNWRDAGPCLSSGKHLLCDSTLLPTDAGARRFDPSRQRRLIDSEASANETARSHLESGEVPGACPVSGV